jgi:hypothetical protein
MRENSTLTRGLLGHWSGYQSPDGIVRNHSPAGADGNYGIDARWIWFTNPRAVRHVGDRDRTYFCYLGGETGTDIVVASYDHDEAALARTDIESEFSADDHTNPSIHVRDDGSILVFWAGHNGDAIHYARAEQPESIETFVAHGSFTGESVTYPNPVRSPFGDDAIYLFYRDRVYTEDATDDRWGYMGDGSLTVRKSMDGGSMWSEATSLVAPPSGHYSMYFIPAVGPEAIHLFFTDAERGGDAPKWNVMYAKYRDDAFYTAANERIGGADALPLEKDELEVVYDSSATDNSHAWVWDAAVDDDGHPVVTYATFPSTLSHEYRWARHDGDRWHDHHLADAGRYIARRPVELHYSGGLSLDRDEPTVVYGCVSRGDDCVIHRYETETGGRTWSETTVAEHARGVDTRPVVPRNASPDVPVLWLRGSYRDMDSSQTVLRGLPADRQAGDVLQSDRTFGVDLGFDLYDQAAFEDGMSVSAVIQPSDPTSTGIVANFGGGITLGTALDGHDGVACRLRGPEETGTVATGAVAPGEHHTVTTTWDTDTLTLAVGADTVDETPFNGPVQLDDDWASWTLLKGSYLMHDAFAGEVTDVRLYDRPLSATEIETLARD